MLIGDNVVFIFRVEWLILRWNEDLVIRECVLAKVLEEIGVPRTIEMDIRVIRILGHFMHSPYVSVRRARHEGLR